jgi:alpha-tubulin suppressor-like RCC1 family protein
MTETGAIFSCGSNTQGQLGIKSSTDRVLFDSIPYLDKEDLVCIAAGARHRFSFPRL